MPLGPITNALSVLLGGLLGAIFRNRIPDRLKVNLPLIFGVIAIGMGVLFIGETNQLPPVVLSLVIGSVIGEWFKLEKRIELFVVKMKNLLHKEGSQQELTVSTEFMEKFVGVMILFCVSSTGVIGALNEGMTGDPSILLSKSFLDFFTAAIFATTLGYMVSMIAIPQIMVLLGLFYSANLLLPFVNAELIGNFSAAGGIILLATGFRITGIKFFPIANMLPALIIVMPISYLWISFF